MYPIKFWYKCINESVGRTEITKKCNIENMFKLTQTHHDLF